MIHRQQWCPPTIQKQLNSQLLIHYYKINQYLNTTLMNKHTKVNTSFPPDGTCVYVCVSNAINLLLFIQIIRTFAIQSCQARPEVNVP